MSDGTLERRRTLGDSVVMNPPAPVIHVYPSYGNTLTAYSASGDRRADKSSSGRSSSSVSTTVTNEDYDWWDAGLTTQELVDMTNYDSIQCTAEAPSGYMNLVWCFIHCPNTIGADLEVNVTYHLTNGTTYAENLGAVTTASRFISLDIDNCFENLGGASQPNDGFPNLDTINLDYITVSAYAFKNNLFSAETLFNIYLDSNPSITVKAPSFYPAAGTYPSTVYVSIMQDSTVPGLTTYYLMSDEPTEPTMQNATPYTDGRQISISSTCYLCAKSFVMMGSGTVVSSQTTYGLYTITNSSTVLNSPVFTPVPGVYSVAQSVEIVNPNNNPNNTQTVYYNLNGSTPNLHSNQYTYPIPVSDTTTISAAVYDSATGVWSDVETGTYTISAQYYTNEVTYMFNSDGTTCCGLYQLAKKSDTGNSNDNYGFSISGTNKSTVVYFTMDGTVPTTSSQQLANGQWYSLSEPNTVLVKYRAVAPNCADALGEFWIRINKCAALYRYSGSKFIIGSSYCNWLNRDLSNYSQNNCVYIYLNGNQLFPDNFSVEFEDVLGTNAGLITYTPSQGTSIDASFLFIYGYSAPYQGDGYNYCPFNLTKELSGSVDDIYLGMKNDVFNRRTGTYTIYVSANELSTLNVSGQMHLTDLNFWGLQSPIVSRCDTRTSLESWTVSYTNLKSIDLSPCLSMVRLENNALADTWNNNSTETGLTSVTMPPRISSLGDGIFSKSGGFVPDKGNIYRRPLTVKFFNPVVPQITSNTFGDYFVGSGAYSPIDSNSTIVVNYEPYHADVCSYENAWHYHQTRSGGTSSTGGNLTNMKIVDQDGLQCGEMPGDIPTVTTGTAASITANSAVVNSNNVTADGGHQIQRRGVCWSTNPSPNIYSQHADATTATTGAFNISLGNSLDRNTTYYYRAYATNEKGIAYGQTKNFTTLDVIVEPTVDSGPYDSDAASNCTVVNREHISGWKVLDNGGSTVMRMAIVYSTTNVSPTKDDNLVYTSYSWTDSSGILHFSGAVDFSGYPEGTTIYIRGAAQNQAGLWGYANFIHEFTVPPSNNIVDPSVGIGGVQYEYLAGEHVVGGLTYPYSVTLNCNVDLGTYGNVIVQFLYAENQIPEQGSGNTAVVDAIQSPVNSSSNCTYKIGLSELETMQPGARYYVKARCRQASDSQWIYSENYTYFDNTYQSGNAHTISATANSSDSVTVRCRYDVLPPSGNHQKYGAAIYDQNPFQEGVEPMRIIDYYNSTNDFVYDKTIDILFNGLDESTTYYVRACYTYTSEQIEYGETLNATTPPITRSCLTVNSGNALSAHRKSAAVNVSFDRWWQLTFTYSWGYDNTIGDRILENQWDYIGDDLGNKTDDYGDNRDLFGWGCTSQHHRSNKYEAWAMGGSDSDYRAYDVSNSGLTNSSYNGQANWGWQSERYDNSSLFQATDYIYSGTGIITPGSHELGSGWESGYGPNDIVAGDVTAQNWSRPLTSSEMSYLLYTRSTVTGKRFCKGRIDKGDGVHVNGLILLYDNWNDGISINGANDATADYTSNTITENQWNSYFSDRAAFLPAAGYTEGDGNVRYANSVGCYWLNDSYSGTYAYCLVFRSNSVDVGIQNKRFRCSVRLFKVW